LEPQVLLLDEPTASLDLGQQPASKHFCQAQETLHHSGRFSQSEPNKADSGQGCVLKGRTTGSGNGGHHLEDADAFQQLMDAAFK